MKKDEKIFAATLIVLSLFTILIIITAKKPHSAKAMYYTQIDNSCMEIISTDNGVINFKGSLPYSYQLMCFDENGNEKELSFTASKELKEDAFICLTVMPLRGVTEWKEVPFDELPKTVQEKYKLNE